MKNYIKLMRPKHYLKNILILLPLCFSGQIFNLDKLSSSILGLISFCLAASIVYIINDIQDKEKDKLHEKKKNRPIAAGKIKVKNAILFAVFLLILSYGITMFIEQKIICKSYIFILVYILINILYSIKLKNIPLVDIGILVSGFLIRTLYGAFLIDVSISNWLYLAIISISFYMGLGKRRNELNKSTSTRKVLEFYNEKFLDKNMYMCLALFIVFYALWCVDPVTVVKTNNLLIWTVPFVILICMKYSMNIENDSYGDPVDVIFSDKVLLSIGIIYAITMFLIIYI